MLNAFSGERIAKEYSSTVYSPEIHEWLDFLGSEKKDLILKVDRIEDIIDRLSLIPEQDEKNKEIELLSGNKVFIVHGHNNAIKESVARTLSKLKLDPIILYEQSNFGKTIIEKFEEYGSDVGFAIILLTGDDQGKAIKEDKVRLRARQNVIFEMGYFIGKLGRKRVFILLEEGVEKPGDLDGLVYTTLDDKGAWKMKLVKELRQCDHSVSANDII